MIVYPENESHNEFLTKWIQRRLPNVRFHDTVCLGVLRCGKLVAVAAFNNYRETDIELSFAADTPRWATREAISGILSYPFVQLKCQRVSCLCHKTNRRVRKLLPGLGFIEEGKLRHAGANKEAMFIYGMTRDDYEQRYLRYVAAPNAKTG